MATDQAQVMSCVAGLRARGAFGGASLVFFNALLAAKAQAAQVGDLPKGPALGRQHHPAEQPHAANDHFVAPDTSGSPIA